MTRPTEYPLLLLPEPVAGQREDLSGGAPRMRKPSRAEQGARVGPRLADLSSQMNREAARLTSMTPGVEPELILIFEIADHVDNFYAAVSRIAGLEFLLGAEDSDIDTEDAFAVTNKAGVDTDGVVSGNAFFVATNTEALSQVQRLWALHQDPARPRFPQGYGPWRELFDLLVDVRPWGPWDRIRDTGVIDDFRARLAADVEDVRAEVELWFRTDASARERSRDQVAQAVTSAGGSVLATSVVAEISYHGMLVRLPSSEVHAIAEGQADNVALLRQGGVAFLRPEAQTTFQIADLGELPGGVQTTEAATVRAMPLVAVLDGVPHPTHVRLRNHLILDDPDNLESLAQVEQRQHGTAIAGAVLHGDLSDPSPPSGPIYHRPILVPSLDYRGRLVESFPADQLPVDLIYRAVRRIVEGDGLEPAQAPTVRIINLSLGDAGNQLGQSISPLARLIDWLSNHYRLLFIISTGNHERVFNLGMPLSEWRALRPDQARHVILGLLAGDALNRRLLSPSEAVNALTVGATHDDASQVAVAGSRVDLLPGARTGPDAAPGLMTGAGSGFRRSVKPDLVAPGGRLVHRSAPSDDANGAIMEPAHSFPVGPGVRVAAAAIGDLDREAHTFGTSVSTALASHHAGRIAKLLSLQLAVPDRFVAVCTKAMLAHGCYYGSIVDELVDAWPDNLPRIKRHVHTRYMGYGVIRPDRVMSGAADRVLLFGYGELQPGAAAAYDVPLPGSLGGKVADRRISITLASFVPIDPRHQLHRAARLYFLPRAEEHAISRSDSDWQLVRGGTLQHEVLTGDRAVPYGDDSVYQVAVSCRPLPEARKDVAPVPYAIVFTLDVPGSRIPVYSEVAARVRARATVAARTRT